MKNINKIIPVLTGVAGAVGTYTAAKNTNNLEMKRIESQERMHERELELKKYEIDKKYETNLNNNNSSLNNDNILNSSENNSNGNSVFEDYFFKVFSDLFTNLSIDQTYGLIFLLYNIGMIISIVFIWLELKIYDLDLNLNNISYFMKIIYYLKKFLKYSSTFNIYFFILCFCLNLGLSLGTSLFLFL